MDLYQCLHLKKVYDPPGLPSGAPKYSIIASTSARNLIFVSGLSAVDSMGKLVGVGDIDAQVEQVFRNLEIALKAQGATFNDVVRFAAYVIDMDKARPAINRVRLKYIQKEAPAAILVGVTRLPDPECLVEIEVIAAMD